MGQSVFMHETNDLARGAMEPEDKGVEIAGVLSRHAQCGYCGEPLLGARFGQRYCSAICRANGRAAEARAARRAWVLAGRPKAEERREARLEVVNGGERKPLAEIMKSLKERTEPQVQQQPPRSSCG